MIKTFRKLLKNRKLFYIVFCFLFWSCGNSNISELKITNKNQDKTNEIKEEQRGNLSEILFENISHDFGSIAQGKQVDYTFHFENVGQTDLIIYSVSASCGCTTPVFSTEPVKQGEKGEITVTFDSNGKSGKINNHVIVSANTYPANVVLTLQAEVIAP